MTEKPEATHGPSDIARRLREKLRRRAHRATEILHKTYGSPRHGNKEDPVDELVFIILSQMTTHWSFNRVFERLKRNYPTWDTAVSAPIKDLASVIADAGLSNQKARCIQMVLDRVRGDFGRVTLAPLEALPDLEAERYLTSLPRVGVKTAKCVMMYSLGRLVLPVDTHVWRLARRLGLVSWELPYTQVHDALESAIRPLDRYGFHVNAIAHGRALCLPKRPRCGSCPLRRLCPFPKLNPGSVL